MPAKAPTTAPDAWQKDSSPSSDIRCSSSVEACVQLVQAHLAAGADVVLACDHSPEGVLAGVGISYLAHAREGQLRLADAHELQLHLGEETVRVPPDSDDATVDLAQRVMRGFAGKVTAGCRKRKVSGCPLNCDNACVRRLVYATASDDEGMPEVVHQYLRLGFRVGPRIRQLIADPTVVAFNDLARAALGECEHTRQFVRFSHMADGSYAASFSPKANTIPLTASHFAARMRTERFFLVDPRHRIVAVHQPSDARCQIARVDAAMAQDLATRTDFAEDEQYVRALWQHFYQGTTTPGRDRSQRGYDLRTQWMPQRFWSGLSELEPQVDPSTLVVPARYAGETSLPTANDPTDTSGVIPGLLESVASVSAS